MPICQNCHSADAKATRDLCTACYMALRRTGRDRPERNILRHNRRTFDQDVERRRAR